MKRKRGAVVLAALLFILPVTIVGCSKKSGPTDADVVKAAIQQAVSEKCNILTPTIKVLSRTISSDSASITIGYQCGGIVNSGIQREMTLHMAASKDSSGRSVWTAR